MYNRNYEMTVLKESLHYMKKANEYANALHMTDHGPLHAQRVYAICRWLGAIFSLTEYESALLQAAALLHDIGMASADRENHNKESEKLVVTRAQEKFLPFSDEEAALVGKLCLWHRGNDYKNDHIEQCENNEIRVGLLASILRLSDELDLDYRRTEVDSLEQMELTKKYKKDQLKYHESVLSILGVRIRADKLTKCFELLIDDISGAKLQIERLIKEILGTPLPFPVKILPTKKNYISTPITHPQKRKAIICAYCNPHGLLTAVLSKMNLKLAGIDAEIICNKEITGNAAVFWKNIENINFSNYELAYFIDLHIDSEVISKIEKIILGKYNCKIFISGSTITASNYVSRLIENGAALLLGDEHALFYADFLTDSMPFWVKVLGMCNFDNHPIQKNTNREIYETTNGLKYAMFNYFANGTDSQLSEIINNIENNCKDFFIERSKCFDVKISTTDVKSITLGRAILIKECNSTPGRFIYEWIIHCIMKNKCLPYENFEFKTPYAIYPVYRTDKISMRVLYVSYFKNSNTTLPIRCFCNQENMSVGMDNTIWKSYSNKTSALSDICKTISSINSEYKDDFMDIESISKAITDYL